jgi:ribosomal protein L1
MTNPVDAKQLAAAANALLAYIHKENQASHNLLDDDAFISLVVALQRTPDKARTKPFYAPLVHSLYKDRPVCLITCDGLYKSVKEHLKAHPVEGIEKVIGITKLRKEFSRYEAKRKLSSTFDLFLADSRLMHLLPKLIGAKFFDKKKHPSLIDLDRSDITPSLIKARDATYFHLRAGPTIMIKIARTSFSDKQILENFNAAIGAIVNQIPKKWKGIQALYLRTATSFALPFYNSLPFSLKIQESDTPLLTLQSNSKRKAAAIEEKGTPAKKAALTSNVPSTAPFTTLTLTGLKPEAEETLTPPTPVGLKPNKKLLKRKADAPSPLVAKVAQSQKKVAPATPAPQVPAASPAAKVPQSQKKAPATPAPKQVSQLQTKAVVTPAPSQAPPASPMALPTPATQKKASAKKKKAVATPAPSQAVPATPETPATPTAQKKAPSKKKKVVSTPAPSEAVATPGPKALATPGKKAALNTPKPAAAPQIPSTLPTAKPMKTPSPGHKKVLRAKSTVKKQ